MSFVLMRFSLLNDMVTPLAIAVNAIPIVVLVSVFNNQFASTSEVPRRLMVTLIVYFIVLVNVAKGLRDVQSTHLELMRSYAASPLEVLRKVRMPNAVPYLFTALKIAAPARRDHRVRRRVPRRSAERARLRASPSNFKVRRTPRLGLCARCLPARAGVLPDLHPAVERLINQLPGRQPRGREHMKQRSKVLSAGALALPLVAIASYGGTGLDSTHRAGGLGGR